jgi:hypothetical protein
MKLIMLFKVMGKKLKKLKKYRNWEINIFNVLN